MFHVVVCDYELGNSFLMYKSAVNHEVKHSICLDQTCFKKKKRNTTFGVFQFHKSSLLQILIVVLFFSSHLISGPYKIYFKEVSELFASCSCSEIKAVEFEFQDFQLSYQRQRMFFFYI